MVPRVRGVRSPAEGWKSGWRCIAGAWEIAERRGLERSRRAPAAQGPEKKAQEDRQRDRAGEEAAPER